MNNDKTWKKVYFPKIISSFSKRIQSVLKTIEELNLPKEEVIKSLYLYGDPGSGKTIMASQRLIAYRKTMFLNSDLFVKSETSFTDVPTFFHFLQMHFDNRIEINSVIEKMSTVPFLVLDDLGVEKTTDFSRSILYMIINNRWENQLTTVITSNLSIKQLEEKLDDERITSRIKRMCLVMHVKNF